MLKFINVFLTSLFFSSRFYWALGTFACLFAVSFLVPALFVIMKVLFYIFIALVLLDYAILFFTGNTVRTKRELPERFSNGDQNAVKILIHNQYPFKATVKIIDELPVQFQKRDFFEEACGGG